MAKKKLKKKVWMTSALVLGVYITALIINPTIWTILLPIIIPTGLLTVGIPTYAVINRTHESLKKTVNKQEPVTSITQKNTISKSKNIEPEYTITSDNYQPEIEKNKVKQKRLKY